MSYFKQFQSNFGNLSDVNILPLSVGQYDIWLEQQIHPHDIHNHFHFVAKICENLDLSIFQKALWKLAERHETLRTYFPTNQQIPIRQLIPIENISLHVEQCSQLCEDEIKLLIQRNFEIPFNLSIEIPCRFVLYQRSNSEYYFQIVKHHIAATINSYASLPIELAQLYISELHKKEAALVKKLVTYSTFVQAHYDYFHSYRFETDKKYWKSYLSGSLPKPVLPLEQFSFSSHPKHQVYHYTLDSSLTNELKILADSLDITFFSLMTASFQLLLHHYTKQEEVIVGIPSDKKRQIENKELFQDLIGYTTNTLPMRSKFVSSQSFSCFAKCVSKDMRNMSKHRLYPLTLILEDLRTEKNISLDEFFKILVVSQKIEEHKDIALFGANKQAVTIDIDGLKYESIGIGFLPTGKFDLALAIIETTSECILSLHYNASAFDDFTIIGLAQNYTTLLQNITYSPNAKIEELSSVSDKEKHLQLDTWNRTASDFKEETTFIESFEKKVSTNPEAIALIFENKEINYNVLNQLTNQFAHHLQKLGATRETLIAIGLERSPEMIIALLAIMKIGSAYLPLDPEHPLKRIQLILDDSQADILITHQSLKNIYCNFEKQMIFIDKEWDEISKNVTENLTINRDPNRLAYVIYTSGSTGRPKGVEITYKSLDNFLCAMQQHLCLNSLDRWLALTTLTFDISNLEILLPLRQGAALILANRETLKDPYLLATALEKHEITFAQATPSTWQLLIDAGWKGNSNLVALCGGEPLSSTLADKLIKLSNALWNMYGPTETTIWSSLKKLNTAQQRITVGKPIANTTFYILNENKQIVPIGVVGELYIGGLGLARSYRHKPALTEANFIPSPFDHSLSSKLYRTGDHARYLINGEIEILGRKDQQVKIRGHRIELGEIEEIIKRCEGIQQAVVKLHEYSSEDKRLIAYFTGSTKEADIKLSLTTQLPNYMIPSAYIQLPQMPLTPNGKIDHKALPLPKKCSIAITTYIFPRNSVEIQVLELFANILNIDKNTISIDSNFFSLGGHSLLAARVVIQINKMFHINLPLKILFEKPTIALISKEIENALRGYEFTLICPQIRNKLIPLSHSQQRFWISELTQTNAIFNVPFILDLTGNLNIPILKQAINTIIQRHEALRTVFREKSEIPEQLILSDVKASLQYIDLRNDLDINRKFKNLIEKEAKKPFALTQIPLFRFLLIQCYENRFSLLLNFHHMIFDGYSINIFLKELKLIYENYLNNESISLSILNIQYADYTYWHNNNAQASITHYHLDWWIKNLADAPQILNLPIDKQRPSIQTYRGDIVEFWIVEYSDLNSLKILAQKHDSTLFMLLLSIFHVFLYRYTGQNDMVIGIPTSGRTHSNLDSLIGCFINTLALRTTSTSNMFFLDLLKFVRNNILEAFKYQDVPFEKIIENLNIERSLNYSPLIQVLFNMLPAIELNEIGNMDLQVKNIYSGTTQFDLSFSIQETPQGLLGTFEYNTDLFFKETIKRMAKHFRHLVQEIIKDPNQIISKLQILSQSEVRKQLIKWNKPLIHYPKNESIIQLIEKWAKYTPNATAVIYKNKNYSYQELNTHANIIAYHLLCSNIKAEDKVIICLERSSLFILAVLGVLKAGGTYIPLDPNEPQERMKSIIQDLNPLCILTTHNLKHIFYNQNCLCIDQLDFSQNANFNSFPSLSEKQLAYIIYTSGSTGKPKGVEIEYQSINDRVLWKNAAYPLSPNDTMLHTYSFIFDGSIINYFWPLCAGAKLLIASQEELLDSEKLIQLIQKYEVSTVDLLPTLLQNLMEEQKFTSCHSLKNVFSGGEALSVGNMHLFFERCLAKLHNTYGPTEATVEVSTWTCTPNYKGLIAPIGKPIAGAKLYILDQDQNITPRGVNGELHIGGIGLARGYFNDPLLTSEKFISNPFNNNERLYRTGDLAKYRQDGTIEFLGRIDNQVKIRGFRVDLKEIESTLMRMDPIDKAIVVVKGESLRKYLVAYVVTSLSMNEETLKILMRHFLQERLPPYMIPEHVVIVNEFPKLLNGKINYKALPEPKRQLHDISCSSNQVCNNDLEQHLLSIWKEILSYDNLSLTDHFFELGGNSLLAMRLIAKIRHKLGLSIPLIHLFQHPTITSFASSINSQTVKIKPPSIVLMKSGGNKKPFFCVHPVGGNILCYSALSKHWTADRPFYAIRAHGIEEDEQPYESIELMAKEYIKAMREIQPTGPYFIGGWSFGGLIATEMVHQLQQQNEEISLLILIDTTANIENFKNIDISDESLLLSELSRYFLVKTAKVNKNLSLKEQLASFIDNGGKKPNVIQAKSALDRLLNLAKSNYRALQNFSVPIINTYVTLIKSQKNLETIPTLGWDKYIAQLDIFEAPGDHWAITQDKQAYHYAKIIQKCFEYSENKTKIILK